jgi:hypothetical protein
MRCPTSPLCDWVISTYFWMTFSTIFEYDSTWFWIFLNDFEWLRDSYIFGTKKQGNGRLVASGGSWCFVSRLWSGIVFVQMSRMNVFMFWPLVMLFHHKSANWTIFCITVYIYIYNIYIWSFYLSTFLSI